MYTVSRTVRSSEKAENHILLLNCYSLFFFVPRFYLFVCCWKFCCRYRVNAAMLLLLLIVDFYFIVLLLSFVHSYLLTHIVMVVLLLFIIFDIFDDDVHFSLHDLSYTLYMFRIILIESDVCVFCI